MLLEITQYIALYLEAAIIYEAQDLCFLAEEVDY